MSQVMFQIQSFNQAKKGKRKLNYKGKQTVDTENGPKRCRAIFAHPETIEYGFRELN